MCDDPSIKGKPIDHSVTLVGFGTDATHGDYWQVKNSWSTKFGNQGFIKVARGVSCARIDCCGNTYTYGDPANYYEEEAEAEVANAATAAAAAASACVGGEAHPQHFESGRRAGGDGRHGSPSAAAAHAPCL